MIAGHLLPVSGTPHAKAALRDAGHARRRARARACGTSLDFWRSTVVTVAARTLLGVVAGLHVRRGSTPYAPAAPRRASSATVRTICSVATAPSSRRSPRPGRRCACPSAPAARSGERRAGRGQQRRRHAAAIDRGDETEREDRPADVHGVGARHGAPADRLEDGDDADGERGAERAPPATASTRLSVSVWRNRRHAPGAERGAHGVLARGAAGRASAAGPPRWRRRSRKTIATEPKSGISSRRPSRLSTSCTGRDARR